MLHLRCSSQAIRPQQPSPVHIVFWKGAGGHRGLMFVCCGSKVFHLTSGNALLLMQADDNGSDRPKCVCHGTRGAGGYIGPKPLQVNRSRGGWELGISGMERVPNTGIGAQDLGQKWIVLF